MKNRPEPFSEERRIELVESYRAYPIAIPESTIAAIEMSLSKWHPRTSQRGLGQCGLCMMFYNRMSHVDKCPECPINIILYNGEEHEGCSRQGHPWMDWDLAEVGSGRSEAADAMYSLIYDAWEKENARIDGEAPK